jgi:uncharacterized membrane protein
MTLEHPLTARYLGKLSDALSALDPAERHEVVEEIRHHIADATAAGRPLERVLEALGPVDQLARAYKVELLLNPKDPRKPRSWRWLRIVGLIGLGSIPTFIICVVLGSIGLSFSLSGIAVFVAGVAAYTGDLPYWVEMDAPPWVALAIGPPLTLLGLLAFVGLVAYVRFVARLVRQVLPRPREAVV